MSVSAGSPRVPSSSPMGISRAGREGLELLAVAAAVLAALRAAGALAAFPGPRGDHVIDSEDHHGRVRRGRDRLSPDADRLHDVLLPHVRDLAREDVHARVLVPLLVLLAELDQGVDRVQARVLRERAGDYLDSIRERLDRDLLAAADARRVVPEAEGDLRRGRAPAGDDLAILDGARNDARRVLKGPLDLVDDVLRPAANQNRYRAGVLAPRDERHLVVADLLLEHELRKAEVVLRELVHVGLLDAANSVDSLLREEVLREVVNALLAEHDRRGRLLDRLDHPP